MRIEFSDDVAAEERVVVVRFRPQNYQLRPLAVRELITLEQARGIIEDAVLLAHGLEYPQETP